METSLKENVERLIATYRNRNKSNKYFLAGYIIDLNFEKANKTQIQIDALELVIIDLEYLLK